LADEKSTVKKLQDALEDAGYDAVLTLDQDEYVLKIEAYMNDKNPTEGYVMDVDDDMIVIKAGSKEYKYALTGDAVIEQDGKEVSFSKFEKDYDDYNYYVSLHMDKNNKVDEIVIESLEDEYNGVLSFINSNRIEFTAGRDVHEYSLAEDPDVEIDGKSATVAKLREGYLAEKVYRVQVDLDRDDNVREIIATSGSADKKDGELKNITSSEIKVVVDDKDFTYDLTRDVDVKINGKNKNLNDLKEYMGEYTFTVELEFDRDGDVTKIDATLAEVGEGELKDIVEKDDMITVSAAGMSVELELASSVDITLDGDDITLTNLNSELDDAYGSSRIYVELDYDKYGRVDEITAYWEDVRGELVAVETRDAEIRVDRTWYMLDRDAEFVYKLSTSVDDSKYSKVSRYDADAYGLDDFLKDCEAAGDICEVALTLDSNDEIVRIKVTAK
ncbi:MAG: hypothetical protein IIU70_00885, partial [Anaerotignum sp.]|nr:hypothetical protein [Anaerotignum sp.]